MTEQELNNKFGICGIPIKPGKLLIGVDSHTNTTWRNVKLSLNDNAFKNILNKPTLKIKTTEVDKQYKELKQIIKPIPNKHNIENFHLALCLLVWKKIAEYWTYVDSDEAQEKSRPSIIQNWSDKYPENKILERLDSMAGYMANPSQINLKEFKKMIDRNLVAMKQTVDRLKKDSGESVDVATTSEKIDHQHKLYAAGSNPKIEEIKKQMDEVKNDSKLSQDEKDAQLKKLHDKLLNKGTIINDDISKEVKQLYRSYLKSLNNYISKAQTELDVEEFSRETADSTLDKLKKLNSEDGLIMVAKAYFEELAGVNNRAKNGDLSEFLSDTGRHSGFLKSVEPSAKSVGKLVASDVAVNLRKKFGGGKVLTEKTEAAKKPKATGNVKEKTSLWETKAISERKK